MREELKGLPDTVDEITVQQVSQEKSQFAEQEGLSYIQNLIDSIFVEKEAQEAYQQLLNAIDLLKTQIQDTQSTICKVLQESTNPTEEQKSLFAEKVNGVIAGLSEIYNSIKEK